MGDYNSNVDLVQSFIDSIPGAPPFDHLLTTQLLKTTNFRPHNYSPYFFNFFLGFIFATYETSYLKEKLGLERSYLKIMHENVGLKFVFFTKTPKENKKKMHVRNVFFTPLMNQHWERGVTKSEFEALRNELLVYGLDIDECTKDLAEYHVKDIMVYENQHPSLNRRKMPVIVQKLVTDPRMIDTSGEIQQQRYENFLTLRKMVFGQANSQAEQAQDGQAVIGVDNFIQGLRTGQSQGYFTNVRMLVKTIVELYRMTKHDFNIQYKPWNGADCGFVHGALTAWYSETDFIPVIVHNIHMPIPKSEETSGLFGRFYMSLERKTNLLNHVALDEHGFVTLGHVDFFVPVAISFTQDFFDNQNPQENLFVDWTLLDRFSARDCWTDQKIIMQVNFLTNNLNAQRSFLTSSQQRANFITTLEYFYDEIMVEKQIKALENLHNFLTTETNVIRHVGKTYSTDETNYLSRYMLGMLSSLSRHNEENQISFINDESSRVSETETTRLFISSKLDKSFKVILEITECPLRLDKRNFVTPSNEELEKILGQPMFEGEDPHGDTLVLSIHQSYQHGKADFIDLNTVPEDYLNRDISIRYVNYKDVIGKETVNLVAIETFNLQNSLLDAAVDSDHESVQEDLEFFLSDSSPYIREKNHFKAFTDGLFHNIIHLQNIIPVRPYHSTSQYAFSYIDRRDRILSNKIPQRKFGIVNFIFSTDQNVEEERFKQSMEEIGRRGKGLRGKIINIVYYAELAATRVHVEDLKASVHGACSDRRRRSAICGTGYLEEKGTIVDMEAYKTIPRTHQILEKMNTISSKITAGFMIRDFVSDMIRGDSSAALQDGSFAVGTILSDKISQAVVQYGTQFMEDGKIILGASLRFTSVLLRRIPTAFMITHLVRSIKEYESNKHDTSASVNIGVDSTFIGIDVIETGIEILELLGAVDGISAITGPIGLAIGAVLIIGANVYETVKRMEAINSKIKLSVGEKIDETVRAFLHLNVEDDILKLINEREANEHLVKNIIPYLHGHPTMKYYFSQSAAIDNGKVKIEEDSIIDLRNEHDFVPSRANPEYQERGVNLFCQIAEMPISQVKKVDEQKSFWQKASSFFSDLAWDAKMLVDLARHDMKTVIYDVAHVKENQLVHGYVCQQSFGLINTNVSHSGVAFFQLGCGFDRVYGILDVSNVFNLSNGHKVIHSGNKDDTFILNGDEIGGILDGSSGHNVLDLSAFGTKHPIVISEYTVTYVTSGKNFTLIIADMDEIIGRKEQVDIMESSLGTKTINLKGGVNKTSSDKIIIPENKNSSLYNMTVAISSNTQVENYGHGNFVFIVDPGVDSVNLLFHTNGSASNNSVLFNDPLIIFQNISSNKILMNEIPYINFTIELIATKSRIYITVPQNIKNFQLLFSDGVIMGIKHGQLFAALQSSLPLLEIIKKYDGFLRSNGISMVAYSIIDSKSVTFNHGRYTFQDDNSNQPTSLNIIHNDPVHESHIICAMGQNILVVKKNISDNISSYSIPDITIHFKTKSTTLLLDVSSISHEISMRYPSYELIIRSKVYVNGTITILLIVIDAKNEHLINKIGKIHLLGALPYKLYRNVQIVNYNVPLLLALQTLKGNLLNYTINNALGIGMVSNKSTEHLNNFDVSQLNNYSNPQLQHQLMNIILIPNQLKFDINSNLIYLTAYDVERYQTINISKNVENYNFYRINETLIITDLTEKFIWDTVNSVTLILENFYEQPKFQTLRIIFSDSSSRSGSSNGKTTAVIHLSQLMGNKNYPGIEELWNVLIKNNDYFYNFPYVV